MVRQFDQRTLFTAPGLDARRQAARPRAAREVRREAREDGAQVRVMLIAIRHDLEPPVYLGPHMLQRLQALLAAPEAATAAATVTHQVATTNESQPAEAPVSYLSAGFQSARFLPPMQESMQNGQNGQDGPRALQPRLVRGDILSDSAGRLYERCGPQIKPLHRLASGPRGEVLELLPLASPVAAADAPRQFQRMFADRGRRRGIRPHVTPQPTLEVRPTETFARPATAPSSLKPPKPEAPTSVAQASAEAAPLNTSIPAEWNQPWEFRLSREEVLYDLQQEAAGRSSLVNALRQLKRRWNQPTALRKWQSLLAGESLEEQLWKVRPPAGQGAHPQVRDWAQQTLALAGYDARVMLLEWEIFWRRKAR